MRYGIRPGVRRLGRYASLSAGAVLAGASTFGVTASGTLTSPKPLAGASDFGVVTSGTIDVAKPLNGASTLSVVTTGALSVPKALDGAVAFGITTTGALTSIGFVGGSTFAITASGTLSVPKPLAGTSTVTVTTVGAFAALTLTTVGQHQIGLFPNPVIATGPVDANIVRINDNITVNALNAHDADAAIHIQSGALSARPATAVQGATYFCSDTRDTYTYLNNAWVQTGWAHWYGSFSDTTNQTISAANTATKVTFNTTDVARGFSLVSSSRMTATYAGVYNFQWSGQFANSDASEQDVDVWIRINGTNVVGSTGRVSIPKKHGSIDGHVLPGWNYYLTLSANDYVELYWAATNTAVSLKTSAASAWAPSTASVIATMNRV